MNHVLTAAGSCNQTFLMTDSGQSTTDSSGQRSIEHKKLCRISQGSRPVFGPSVTFSPRVTVINNEMKNSIVSTPAPMLQQQQAPAIVARGVGNYLPPGAPGRRRLETLDSDPYYSSSGSDEGYHGGYPVAGGAVASSTNEILGVKVCDFQDDKYAFDKIESVSGSSPQSCSSLSSHSSHFNNAEFNNKLTLQDSGYSTNSLPFGGGGDCSSSSIIDQDQYNTLLDFSLKLGYSEQQLKIVLVRLSSSNVTNNCCFPVEQIFGQDKILSELIKLGQEINNVVDNNDGGGAIVNNEKSSCNCSTIDGNESAAENTQKINQGTLRRAIVIDGSNVAMTHGHKEIFSCKGIKECVDWFKERGHADIKVFVPQFRKEASRPDAPITDQHILFDLEQEGILIWTPSRRLGGGRRIVCHDDKYIVKTAHDKEAVIVSNDEYRDIAKENAEFKKVVEDRLLMYSFVDGKFMPPDDPLGRYGPTLEQFLRKGPTNAIATLCPYGRKCTYGSKCKFSHPERPGGLHKSVTERLKDHADLHRRISPSNSLQPQKSDVAISQNAAKNCNNSLKATFSCPQHHSPASRSQSLNFNHQNRFVSTVKNGFNLAATPKMTANLRNNFPAATAFPPIFSAVAADGYCTTFPTRPVHHHHQQQQRPQILARESLAKQYSDPLYVTTRPTPSLLGVGQRPPFAPQTAMGAVGGDFVTRATPPDENFVLPPGLRRIWQHHAPVGRNFSAPGVPQHSYGNDVAESPHFCLPPSCSTFNFRTNGAAATAQSPLANEKTRKNSISDTRLNVVGGGPLTAPGAGASDWLFLTSSNVWAPLTTTNDADENVNHVSATKAENWPAPVFGDDDDERRNFWEKRRQLFYHLSKLFPDDVVDRVMTSNPQERDAQRLCQLILAENAKN